MPGSTDNSVDVVPFLTASPGWSPWSLRTTSPASGPDHAVETIASATATCARCSKPNRRAIVHFALDSETEMRTWLVSDASHFLPFNKGNGMNGAATPPIRTGTAPSTCTARLSRQPARHHPKALRARGLRPRDARHEAHHLPTLPSARRGAQARGDAREAQGRATSSSTRRIGQSNPARPSPAVAARCVRQPRVRHGGHPHRPAQSGHAAPPKPSTVDHKRGGGGACASRTAVRGFAGQSTPVRQIITSTIQKFPTSAARPR